jgi:hypothetical protein
LKSEVTIYLRDYVRKKNNDLFPLKLKNKEIHKSWKIRMENEAYQKYQREFHKKSNRTVLFEKEKVEDFQNENINNVNKEIEQIQNKKDKKVKKESFILIPNSKKLKVDITNIEKLSKKEREKLSKKGLVSWTGTKIKF